MISISVIIPTYNVAEYIEEGLQSVLDQTYPCFEIICVDDGSTDKTVEIIKKIQERHPQKIFLFQNDQNRGATYSRNKGLAIAKGDYIQFFDADDLLLAHKFETQVKAIEQAETPPDILVNAYYRRALNGEETLCLYLEQDIWCAAMETALGITSSNLYKRESVLSVKGWNEGLKSSQEYELMFRMLVKGGTVKFDSTVVCIIRERESGSISKSNPGEKWLRYINVRIRIYNYLKDNNMLTEKRRQRFINVMFYSIRILYKYNKEEAVKLHRKYITSKKPLKPDTITTQRYLSFYKIFGFKAAELLSKLFNPNQNVIH